MAPLTAVPVSVTEPLALTAPVLMTGAVGSTVTFRGLEDALVPAEVVSVAVNAYAADDRSAVVKVQAPVLLAVVVPSALAPPSDTVTVAPPTAVPVRVTELLELTTPVLMTGAAGAADSVMPIAFESPLVPADVVAVASNP